MDPDLPLTKLPVHNPPDCFPLCFRSSRNVFDLLRYIARSYVYRILIELLVYYTYSSATQREKHAYSQACISQACISKRAS
jgi:hypothetical protein